MMPINIQDLDKLIQEEQLITGQEAINLSGMQDSLIEELAQQNRYFGSMTVFRVADQRHFPPFNSPGAPKPSSVYSKTSYLVGGYIPMDPIFTRPDTSGNPMGHHCLDDLENQEQIQVKWTLWEILKRCNANGDLNVEWPTEAHAIVRFSFKPGKGPKGFLGRFQVDLGEEKNPQKDITDNRFITRESDNPNKYLNLIPDKIKTTFLGNDEHIISVPYKVFYNKEINGSFEPLMVFAYNNKPIISDWDKVLDCLPLNTVVENLQLSNTEYNTMFTPENDKVMDQQKELVEATKKLFINLIVSVQPFTPLNHDKYCSQYLSTRFFERR